MENPAESDIAAIQRLIKENEQIRYQNASMKSTIFLLKSTVEAYTGKYNIPVMEYKNVKRFIPGKDNDPDYIGYYELVERVVRK